MEGNFVSVCDRRQTGAFRDEFRDEVRRRRDGATDLLVRVRKRIGIISRNRVEDVARVRRPWLVLAVCLNAIYKLRSTVLQRNSVAVVFVELFWERNAMKTAVI